MANKFFKLMLIILFTNFVIYESTGQVSNKLVNNNTGATTTGYFTQGSNSILAFGNNILVAFDDAGSLGNASKVIGYAYSTDGGANFIDAGTLPTSGIGDGGDPVLARNNSTGRIYLAANGFTTTNIIPIFRSDDNGQTWMTPTNGSPGGNQEDKPWIAVDNNSGTGSGTVYVMSRRFGGTPGMYLFKSTDDGATFTPSLGTLITTSTGSQGAFVTVGIDHAVYAFWNEGATIKMRKSTTLGATFLPEVTVVSGLIGGANGDLNLTGIRQGLPTPASFRTTEFPQVAINPASGHIYVTYDNDGAGSDKGDIFFVMSADGGSTWSSPVKVNDDNSTTDQWEPTIAVTSDGTHLGIFYNSRQRDPVNNNLFNYYSRIANISGTTVTFSPGIAVSNVSSFPEFGRDVVVNPAYMGTYNGVAAAENGFFVTWHDNRDDLPNGSGRKDPNVYYSSFSSDGPTPSPSLAFSSQSISGGNGNGVVDLNECNQLSIALKNIGEGTATNITSTLTTNTPGVTITQANSAYANISGGAMGTNSTAFIICTSSSFTCGSIIHFTLTVNYSGGSNQFNLSLTTGMQAATPMSFDYNTVTPILDNTTTYIPINVSGFTGSIQKVTLSLYATHTFDSDLQLYLISPGGFTVALSVGNGSSGDNYGSSCISRTIFDDDAATPITAGSPPFAGSYRPQVPLSSFNGTSGTDVNGTWTLRIQDVAANDVGVFNCATLNLYQAVCTSVQDVNVTINQAATQSDPATTSPVHFTVQFSEAVTGFTGSDISFTGSTVNGTLVATVTGGPAIYDVAVSGMTSSGNIVASIPAGAAMSASSQPNLSSTSIDNTVEFIPGVVNVTINQAATQSDPATSSPVHFTVQFTEAVTGFTGSDVSFTGSTVTGTLVATVTGGPTVYDIAVSGMTSSGNIVATIPAGAAMSASSQPNLASTSIDNTIAFVLCPTWYQDSDGDGYGNPAESIVSCTQPAGYVSNSNDCDDTEEFVHPGATEICNNADDDCDGQVDEGCPLVPTITINDVAVYETSGQAILTVTMSRTLNVPVKVRYKTIDGTAVSTGKDKDFKKVGNASVIIPAGSLTATIPIEIYNDIIQEPDEYFDVFLIRASDATIIDNTGRVTIHNGSPVTMKHIETMPSEISTENLSVIAYPNPTSNIFTLNVRSNKNEIVNVEVADMNGRLIEKRTVAANSNFNFGEKYSTGVYVITVRQNQIEKQIRLVKTAGKAY